MHHAAIPTITRHCTLRTVDHAGIDRRRNSGCNTFIHKRANVRVERVEQSRRAAVAVLRKLVEQEHAVHVAGRAAVPQQERRQSTQAAQQLRQIAAAGAHELAGDGDTDGHMRSPPPVAVLLHAVAQVPAASEGGL